MKSGRGSALSSTPLVRFLTTPLPRSYSTSSPVEKWALTPPQIITGSPWFTAFLKKILAKDSAITAPTPAPFRASGACSLLDPHPKFFPAMITSPSLTLEGNSGSRFSRACLPSSWGLLFTRYLPGMMSSVETLSPRTQALGIKPPSDRSVPPSGRRRPRWRGRPDRSRPRGFPSSP